MGHEIDMTTGEAAFVYNQQNGDPWHILGTPAQGAMTGEELFEICPALDFEVEKRGVLYEAIFGKPDPDDEVNGVVAPAIAAYKGWTVVVRTDTNMPLGIVRDSYSLFQNRELTQFADAVRGASDAAYDTAGSLFGGRVVFAQLILGEDFRIGDDPSDWQRRLLVWAGHDGRHALMAKRTHTRVVCANTLGIANGEVSPTYSVRHTANMDVAVEDARRALQMVAAYDQTFEQAMEALSGRQVDVSAVEAFIEALFPIDPKSENPYRTERYRNEVRSLFDGSPTLVGVPKTAYRLYQAVAEWADHYRTYRAKGGTPADARALSIVEGSAQRIKDRALALIPVR